MIESESAEARAVTARIADSYDRIPYNPKSVGSPALDPSLVLGLAALYGDVPARGTLDVLDLGCGSGGQLARVGAQTQGRLVGIDVSQVSCAEAAAKCRALGGRCSILCADLLDMDTAALGEFDLIYVVGVLFVVPPLVQKRLLEITAAHLKPGGVAVISYYSGLVGREIADLRAKVRAAVDLSGPVDAQIRAARKIAGDIASTHDHANAALGVVINHVMSCDDATFFHEILGPALTPVATRDLQAGLGGRGVHFLNWLTPGPFGGLARAQERAEVADQVSGYHLAVFAKQADPEIGTATWADVQWQTRLVRAGDSASGQPVFRDPESGLGAEVSNPATAAALDQLAGRPIAWSELVQAVAVKFGSRTAVPRIKADFLSLWQHRLMTPCWKGLLMLGCHEDIGLIDLIQCLAA